MLVAGIAGFKRRIAATTPSARLLRRWVDRNHFTWLVSRDILDEYRDVLRRLRVRPHVIGRVLNLLAEGAETVSVGPLPEAHPDPGDAHIWACAEAGGADFIVTLNPDDFPRERIAAAVIGPTDSIPSRHRRPPARRDRRRRHA